MIQVWSISEPTWLHFGWVLGPKLRPSWHQNAKKIDPTTHPKKYHIFDRLRIDFGTILAGSWEGQGGPTNRLWTLFLDVGAKMAPRPPQDSPKTPPRAPKTPSSSDFGTIFCQSLIDLLWLSTLDFYFNELLHCYMNNGCFLVPKSNILRACASVVCTKVITLCN